MAALVGCAVIALGGSFGLSRVAQADGGTTIFVSPSGNDADSGLDPADAVRTLPRAQEIVRGLVGSMTADITVQLAGGIYRLSSPLTFTSADSGRDGHYVIWSAVPGQTAVVSGAEKITGWTAGPKNIWSAPIPANLQTRQIYVNGARAYMASGLPPVTLKRTATGYTASSAVMSTWKNPTEIEFVYPGSIGYMVEPICPVASIKKQTITMAQPCWNNSNLRGTNASRNIVGYPNSKLELPAYIQNALPLLTKPGQFYLDQSAHLLYYMPRANQDMNTADVEVPAVQALMQGSGTAGGAPLQNIEFNNLQFSYATWMQPEQPDGFSEEQSGYYIAGQNAWAGEGLCHTVSNGSCPFGGWHKESGSVQFADDQNISFSGDQFIHLGGAALNLDNGSQNDSVEGSVFTDISGNGIELGNVNKPMATGSEQTTGDTISDNYLYGFPVEFHGGVPIVAGYVSDTTIAHNDVHDTPWAAISLGWGGWLDKLNQSPVPNNDQKNLISDNLIYNFMEGLKDGGGVYTQGIQGPNMANGLRVSGNVIYNQLDWGGALKSDDGTSFVTYSGNVMYNDFYDWDGPLADHEAGATTKYDPVTLQGNYWQQGNLIPNGKYAGVTVSNNSVITGSSGAPASIVDAAGLESGDQALAAYSLEGSAPPAAPQMVSVLYAYKNKAYVTWHPSYDAGSAPVMTYTIEACVATTTGQCIGKALKPSERRATLLDSEGYGQISGLKSNTRYAISVSASNADGTSVPSVPVVVRTVGQSPSKPKAPKSLKALPAAGGFVTLIWNHPGSTKGVQNLVQPHFRTAAASPDSNNFVLGYVISGSNGKKYSLTSHVALVETNTNGRVLYVVGGLTPGKKYTFSVVAMNPAGKGRPATVSVKAE